MKKEKKYVMVNKLLKMEKQCLQEHAGEGLCRRRVKGRPAACARKSMEGKRRKGNDLPLALTLGRECINPRPLDEKQIHHAYCESFIGSIGYSEGINDDVNQFVWLDQEWNPDTPVVDTLRDYAGLLIDWEQRDELAQGILALERNLRGPLAVNENVETCLMQWQDMERRLCDFGRNNYRFEMNLLRACFDAYQKNRYLYETHLEKEAMQVLWQCRETGAVRAMEQAEEILERARTQRVCPGYRARIEQLCDALFQHIGMQLTVSRHGGQHWVRGAFVECLDIPLNDYRYLTASLSASVRRRTPRRSLPARTLLPLETRRACCSAATRPTASSCFGSC